MEDYRIPSSELPTEAQGRFLVVVARDELHRHFGLEPAQGARVPVDLAASVGGVFATLELEGELRGCIGFLRRDVDLVTLTKRAVVSAALDDPRFGSLSREDIPRVGISITVLALPEILRDPAELEIGRDGLIVERGSARGLLLPQVASRRGWDRERFLGETCRKAGLPLESWRDSETSVQRFAAVHFEERDETSVP
jgi:AmmeMemoRadiSam system protein A